MSESLDSASWRERLVLSDWGRAQTMRFFLSSVALQPHSFSDELPAGLSEFDGVVYFDEGLAEFGHPAHGFPTCDVEWRWKCKVCCVHVMLGSPSKHSICMVTQ